MTEAERLVEQAREYQLGGTGPIETLKVGTLILLVGAIVAALEELTDAVRAAGGLATRADRD